MDLALNKLQSLIYHKTQRNKQTNKQFHSTSTIKLVSLPTAKIQR